eukprot:11667-Amphidinium_carterae.2
MERQTPRQGALPKCMTSEKNSVVTMATLCAKSSKVSTTASQAPVHARLASKTTWSHEVVPCFLSVFVTLCESFLPSVFAGFDAPLRSHQEDL